MTRRPDVFSKEAFQMSLREQGCTESFVSPITSDFRLFVSLVFRELGEERVLALVESAREELHLGEQRAAWQMAVKHIVGWANEEIENYIARKIRR